MPSRPSRDGGARPARGTLDGEIAREAVREYVDNGMNGFRLTLTNDEAYDLVIDVAGGRLDDVPAIASALERASEPR